MKHFPQILSLAAAILLAGCAQNSIENNFYAHLAQYRAFGGTTDEPSCGGTGVEFYFDGDQLRKIAYSIETSQRTIDRAYYFRDGKPILVVEISNFLLDDHGNHLPSPRFEYTRSYRLDKLGEVPPDKKNDFEIHAAYLIRYFSQHKSEFTPANPLK
jgi:hypothetical protein